MGNLDLLSLQVHIYLDFLVIQFLNIFPTTLFYICQLTIFIIICIIIRMTVRLLDWFDHQKIKLFRYYFLSLNIVTS